MSGRPSERNEVPATFGLKIGAKIRLGAFSLSRSLTMPPRVRSGAVNGLDVTGGDDDDDAFAKTTNEKADSVLSPGE